MSRRSLRRDLRMSKVLWLMLASLPVLAQTGDDTARIEAVALDYIEGWYTGDAQRTEQVLHPDLAKRMVAEDSDTGRSVLDHQSAMTLVLNTRAGYGRQIPDGRRIREISVLDRFHNAASVKIIAADWVDYLHLVKWNGEWKIINVLWELNPSE